MAQSSAFEYLRHGQTPFFRLPVAVPLSASERGSALDAVLLGVPHDGGTTYQPGAAVSFDQRFNAVRNAELLILQVLRLIMGASYLRP